MTEIRVRFAPSPTGELHIGGARTALFNYLFARSRSGKFILRIDDTDLERSRPEYIDKLLDALQWLQLNWDEGPYFQSKRLPEYKNEAERLIGSKKAYRCYCSIAELEAGRTEARNDRRSFLYPGTCRNLTAEQEELYRQQNRKPVTRLVSPEQGETVVNDLIRGPVHFANTDLDDFIIVKSNELPTYNFASVVDDWQMNITHVIRGEEHLSNTPRQQICAVALGYDLPVYAHVPMILAPDRSKLSKRHGATSVEEFRDAGYLPEALNNYMCLLGWAPEDEGEIFTLAKLIKMFSLDRVHKTAAVYDVNKLAWMNSHYIREYDSEKLINAALPFFENRKLLQAPLSEHEHKYLNEVIEAIKERVKTLEEMAETAEYFYSDRYTYDPKGLEKHLNREDAPVLLRLLADLLQKCDPFTVEELENIFNNLSNTKSVGLGRLIQTTRIAVTGRTGGPGIYELLALLGKKETVSRLTKTAEYIEEELVTDSKSS